MLSIIVLDCTAQKAVDNLRNNNLLVRMNSAGLLVDSASTPAIRTIGGLSLLDQAGVWMSAIDANGVIRVAAHNVVGKTSDLWAGPLQTSNEIASDSNSWRKVWYVNQSMVDYHVSNYKNNGYSAASELVNWPGNGQSGYANILAAFVDNEVNDMKYNPSNGDYPYLQTSSNLLSISNDRANTHLVSKAQPLGVELHTSIMGFGEKDSALKNCFMVRYSVFNRSPRNYTNFRFSTVMNFGIGVFDNEYLGTDVGNKILFAINDTSEATYSNKLVSMGCMALNRQLSSTMYFENSADPVNGLPVIDSHYVRLMNGYWKNGKRLVYGGNGVDASGTDAQFVYPYNTDASHGNIMWSDNESYQPGKRFGIMNFDSINLASGAGIYYDVLYFYVEENNFDIKQISNSCLKFKQVLSTKNLLKTDNIRRNNTQNLELYPNPVKAGEKMVIRLALESPTNIRVIGLDGREIVKLDLDNFDNSIILPEDLSEGMYLLEYETLNTKWYTKFILNH